jgi:hypothetical protein
MSASKESVGSPKSAQVCVDDSNDLISIPFSRARAEREILMDIMAMSDEQSLCQLDPEERKKFTVEAIGEVVQMDTQEIVAIAAAAGPTASFSNGVGCKGTQGFSQGITCKLILRR